jgi:hypothetical protein
MDSVSTSPSRRPNQSLAQSSANIPDDEYVIITTAVIAYPNLSPFQLTMIHQPSNHLGIYK